MPYYVYRIESRGLVRKLESMGVFDDFARARLDCRRLRAAMDQGGVSFRLIFADDALRAEELLTRVREPGPIVEEDD